jgi:gamma-glutamyl-gamma-aminobutyrate hydrolase PuuD
VLFTGGGLELVTAEGEQHPYYVTAKKIMDNSKYMKDEKNEDWPVLGICQGHEVVSIILGEDKIETLSEVVIYG